MRRKNDPLKQKGSEVNEKKKKKNEKVQEEGGWRRLINKTEKSYGERMFDDKRL